ncbi:MAG: glycosyltransferase family 4 protein [Methanobacterium formicicum]
MNVGILSWIIDRQRTGVDNYLYGTVNEMIKMGKSNNITLIHHKKTDDDIYKHCREVLIPYLPLNLTCHLGMPYALMKSKVDLVHFPAHWHTQTSAFFLNRGVKKVLTIHDLIPLLYPESYPPNLARRWNTSLKMIVNHADHIIAVSQKTREDCVKHLNMSPDKITVIPNGYNPIYHPMDNRDEVRKYMKDKYNLNQYILFVGRVEARKNIIPVIRTLHEIKKSGLPHKLVIIGGMGWEHEKVLQEIEKLNLNDQVIFPGYISVEDLVRFYNAADLFVYLSFYEGFGLPPLEAMACGTPVITSNTSSLPEVVGDAGVMVDPLDEEALTSSMHQILCDERKRNKLRDKSILRAKDFSWHKTAKETWEVYEKVCRI